MRGAGSCLSAVSLSVCLPVCLSACLPVCPSVCLSAHCLSHAFRLPVFCLSFVSRLSLAHLSSVSHLFVGCLSLVVVCLSSVFVCISSVCRLLLVWLPIVCSLSPMCSSSVPHLSCHFSVCILSVVCLLPICRLSRRYLSFLNEMNLLFMFGLSSVRRLLLSSVWRLPVPLYLACVVCL